MYSLLSNTQTSWLLLTWTWQKKGNISDVKYMENIDFSDTIVNVNLTKHRGTCLSAFNGSFPRQQKTKRSLTVTIINAETRMIHGKIGGVNGGRFAVCVPGLTSRVISRTTPGIIKNETTGSTNRATTGPTTREPFDQYTSRELSDFFCLFVLFTYKTIKTAKINVNLNVICILSNAVNLFRATIVGNLLPSITGNKISFLLLLWHCCFV